VMMLAASPLLIVLGRASLWWLFWIVVVVALVAGLALHVHLRRRLLGRVDKQRFGDSTSER